MKLSISQIKQIAGRAGRYRTANQHQGEDNAETKIIDSEDARVSSFKGSVKQLNVGLVTCLDERDLYDIQMALNSEPDPIKAAGLLAPVEFIDAFANSLPPGTPFDYLLQRLNDQVLTHPRYFLCRIRDQKAIASCIDSVKGLSILQNCVLTAAPVDTKTETGKKVVRALAGCIANRRAVTVIDVPEIPLDVLDRPLSGDREYLLQLELLHKSLILYLWLSYRFSNILLDREMATQAKEMVEEKINTTLLEFSANPKLRNKLLQMRHTEPAEGASNDPPDGSHELVAAVAKPVTVEEDLVESLHDLSALPVGWENRPPADGMNPDAKVLEIRLPADAQP